MARHPIRQYALIHRLEPRVLMSAVRQADNGTISGTVFNDVNANRQLDAGESGIPGITVYLDQNDNGVLDPDEQSIVTGSDGTYLFSNLVPGDYSVREIVPAG